MKPSYYLGKFLPLFHRGLVTYSTMTPGTVFRTIRFDRFLSLAGTSGGGNRSGIFRRLIPDWARTAFSMLGACGEFTGAGLMVLP